MQLRKTPQAHPVLWSGAPFLINSISLALARARRMASTSQHSSAAGILHNELLYRVQLAVTCAAVGKLNFDRRVSPLENGAVFKTWTSDVDEIQDTKNSRE